MTTETATKSKAPSHLAYQIREREGQKGFWTRIGSACQHQDQKRFSIQLEALPLDGRVTLRFASEATE